jgi:hypothetical protein
VNAIRAPPAGSCFEEEPLVNTIAFSVQGFYCFSFLLFVCLNPLSTDERSLPFCLGRGDGDLYNLIPHNNPDLPGLKDFLPQTMTQHQEKFWIG